ncbi:MAG TPA: NnrS family protein [Burkholderiales bacterium]|nr:NnrS family protein [Burkholderiales bacterium]
MSADQTKHSPSTQAFALWNLGFRPFYLLAGLFAALSIAFWVAQFAGWLGPGVYFSNPLWHAHEMIFGYAFAVIVGFLFTAIRTWTGRPTSSGIKLGGIAALWVAGRVLVLTPWPMLAAAADTAFALAAAAGMAVPLIAGRIRRNYFLIALLLGLGAANLVFHLAMAQLIELPVQRGLQLALNLILFLMAVMGGRVIPMFSANAVLGTKIMRFPWLERIALGSVLALLVADFLNLQPMIIAAVAAIAAAAHAVRLATWKPWLVMGRPILWILHASYAWIAVYLALHALVALGVIPASPATHALTVGAIGGLTIGMMTRTARGHTGRPLQASMIETACYALVQLAAVVRVFVPIFAPQLYLAAIIMSGALWSIAFLMFSVMFWPILSRPRIDGRGG